jgi:hypothetical protein
MKIKLLFLNYGLSKIDKEIDKKQNEKYGYFLF